MFNIRIIPQVSSIQICRVDFYYNTGMSHLERNLGPQTSDPSSNSPSEFGQNYWTLGETFNRKGNTFLSQLSCLLQSLDNQI